jgi:hypothetical protein
MLPDLGNLVRWTLTEEAGCAAGWMEVIVPASNGQSLSPFAAQGLPLYYSILICSLVSFSIF